jgi:serine/threonine-protein kinase
MLGSPLYMSPEQLRSSKNVDARADVWSIGVILFELLTGRVPFNGESLGELFVAILESPTPRVSQYRQDVPQILDEAILRCLQRPLEARFQNVAELAQALAPCAPARAQISVERILSTLGRAQDGSSSGSGPRPVLPSHPGALSGSHSGVKTMPLPQQPPQPALSSTPDAWGRTSLATQRPKRTGLYIGLGVGGLCLLLGAGGAIAYGVRHNQADTQVPNAAPTTLATNSPETVTTSSSAPSGETTAPPSMSSSTQATVPAATASATVTSAATTATGAAQRVKPPATTTTAKTGATASAPAPATTAPGTASTGTTPPSFDPFSAGRNDKKK